MYKPFDDNLLNVENIEEIQNENPNGKCLYFTAT